MLSLKTALLTVFGFYLVVGILDMLGNYFLAAKRDDRKDDQK